MLEESFATFEFAKNAEHPSLGTLVVGEWFSWITDVTSVCTRLPGNKYIQWYHDGSCDVVACDLELTRVIRREVTIKVGR